MAKRFSALPKWASVPLFVVCGLVGLYTAGLSFLSIRERAALYQFDEDLAIYDQIVWNTSRGRLFESTIIQHAATMLGDHFSPAVAIFAPVYWIWSDPRVLLVGQSLVLGLAAVPIYLAARKMVGEVAALFVAAAYLIQPALHFVNLFQFHEIALLPLPLSCALLSVERGWRRRFFASTVLSLLVKEEVAIVVVSLGALWWLRRRDAQMAVATAILGCVTGYATMGVILPHFSQAGSGYYYVQRYAYLGRSVPEMIVTAVTRPGIVLAHLITADRLTFLAKLFLPLALVPLVGWEYLVAALPVFGYLLLADVPDQYAIDRHYLTPLLPFLIFGTILGLARIGSLLRKNYQVLATVGASGILVVGALASYDFGPTPLARSYDARAFTISHQTIETRDLIAQIPSTASVSTSHNLVSWFSERQRIYRWPEVSEADYVLLDWRDLRYPAIYGMDFNAFGNLLASPTYRLIEQRGSVTLFQRKDPVGWAGPTDRIVRFGDQIELLDARATVESGSSIVAVTFDWRALRPLKAQYTVFVHVVGPDGKSLGQSDSLPLDNLVPTDLWTPGHVLPDAHFVSLRTPAPTSGVKVEAGLYELKTGARLPVTARGIGGGSDSVVFDVTSP